MPPLPPPYLGDVAGPGPVLIRINGRKTATTVNTTMRLNVQHENLRSCHELDLRVEREVLALGETRQIDEATIRLIHVPDASPAYQVHAHLVTPGPDVFAEACDHTLSAAFTKVIAQLRNKILVRTQRRAARKRVQLLTWRTA